MKRRDTKPLAIILVVLLIAVAAATCSVLWLYQTGEYPAELLSLIVGVCDVLASIVAGAFIVAQLQSEANSDIERAKTEEAKFILELNTSFLDNKELCMVEHYLEDSVTHMGTGGVSSLNDVRQSLVNYLVYLEGFASCVQQNMMKLSDIDALFSYRFFLAMNHPEVQQLEIVPYASFYRGDYQLYDDWYKFRMKRSKKDYLDDSRDCGTVMPLADTSLFLVVGYEKHLRDWIDVRLEPDASGERVFKTTFRYDNREYVYDESRGVVPRGRVPDEMVRRVRFAIEKSEAYYARFGGAQLDADTSVTLEQYSQISELIHETDPYIYPALFGEGETGLRNAKALLPQVFEAGKDRMFRKQNLYVLYERDDVVGIILWHQGSVAWNSHLFLSIAKGSGIELDDAKVNAVMTEYMRARYEYEPGETEEAISLVNICVSSRLRGRGIGRLMMTEFLNEHQNDKMRLCVLKSNASAVRLYETLGFGKKAESCGFSLGSDKPMCYEMER